MPIRIVNLDTVPVTLYKKIKIVTAELINDEAICSTSESEQLTTDLELDILLHPLPHDITESQKEQFLALMSHYSCVIAKNSNDLGHTQVMHYRIAPNFRSRKFL